jgi:hypothetical protein
MLQQETRFFHTFDEKRKEKRRADNIDQQQESKKVIGQLLRKCN